MEDWNELRLILAVERAGGLTEAARLLGVDHSTAYRRLNAVEARLAVRLFERLPGGNYRVTDAGARMAAAAERMEQEVLAVDRDLTGRDRRLSGRLKVTSSETIAFSCLTGHLATFRREHPGIVVELTVENRVLSLSRREADIALRPIRPKEGDLWGRKLAVVAWAAYGRREFLTGHSGPFSGPGDLAGLAMIGWEEGVSGIRAADWLGRLLTPEVYAYRTNSLINQYLAAKSGIGLALLPCYLGDGDPDIVRILEAPVPELKGELWIVTHADLKATARVRAFFDIVGEALARERARFEGAGW